MNLTEEANVLRLRLSTDEHDVKKKRHRRGRKRRWKPYSQMTVEERKIMEEKKASKTAKVEEKLAQLGKPVAPRNSTSFLIEDREDTEEVERQVSRFLQRSKSTSSPPSGEDAHDAVSDEEFYESPDESVAESEENLEKDFEAQYAEAYRERYQDMSKGELVDECIKLEQLRQSEEDSAAGKIAELQAEIAVLRSLNAPVCREDNGHSTTQEGSECSSAS